MFGFFLILILKEKEANKFASIAKMFTFSPADGHLSKISHFLRANRVLFLTATLFH